MSADELASFDQVRLTTRATPSLAPLLDAQSIAVIGASENPERVGGMPLDFLLHAGYQGKVFAVNPSRSSVQGQPSYPDILSVPDPVELAVIAVPASAVFDVIQQCVTANVRAAIVFSAGFAEVGGSGIQTQQRLAHVAKAGGLRLCGPNCAGIINARTHMTAAFGSHLAHDTTVPVGRVAIISQSGAIGAYLFSLARRRRVGLSYWVTTGNEADAELSEYVREIAQRDDTDVIALYIEQLRNGEGLMEACRLAHRAGKTLVAIAAGRTTASKEALQSHTAAIAGDVRVTAAALDELGIIRVDTLDELLNAIIGLTAAHRPRGRGVGIVTISGGAGIMMVDQCVDRGLSTPQIAGTRQREMRRLLSFAATANPVDVTGNIVNRPDVFAPFLREVLASDEIDGILCFLGHVILSPSVGSKLVEEAIAASSRTGQPVWLIGLDDDHSVVDRLSRARVPLFSDPAQAVNAFAVAAAAWEWSAAVDEPAILFRRQQDWTSNSKPELRAEGRWIDEVTAQRVLAGAGISFPAQEFVRSPEEAALAATRWGSDVVVKVVARDVPHKSQAGGVRVGVPPDGGADAYSEVVAQVRAVRPAVDVAGALIQEQLDGYPVIVGVRRDGVFGPVVVVGSGGGDAERIGDHAMALAPLDVESAANLVARAGINRRLGEVGPESGRLGEQLASLIASLSQFAWTHRDDVASVELNPVLVGPRGVFAVDALIETAV